MLVEKLRIVNSGETLIFEDKKEDVKSIDLDIEKGIIQIEYETNTEWRYSWIPLNNLDKIDFNILPDDLATMLSHVIKKD